MGVSFYTQGEESYQFGEDIVKDLNLKVVYHAMVQGKSEDLPYVREETLRPLTDVSLLKERQELVSACCQHGGIIEAMYPIVVKMTKDLRNHLESIRVNRDKNLKKETNISIHLEAIRGLVHGLHHLDAVVAEHEEAFRTTALRRFYKEFYDEMERDRIEALETNVNRLDGFKNQGEIVLGAELGEGLKLQSVEILETHEKTNKGWNPFNKENKGSITDKDVYESGVEMANHVILGLLAVFEDFLKEWDGFLCVLRKQIAFLMGCVTMYKRGRERGFYFTMPDLDSCAKGDATFDRLYELSLAFQTKDFPETNRLDHTGKQFVIITGANQGGKSTFLRSVGIAQVLYQCGVFVPAKKYSSKLYRNIFTHFTRREDARMNTGRFEEEMKRMERIIYGVTDDSLLLLNESFATTTEISAARIAGDLVHAMEGEKVDVWMVTHINRFATDFYKEGNPKSLFLSAGRREENETPYQMVEKEPIDTSYGMDLYDKVITKEFFNENEK